MQFDYTFKGSTAVVNRLDQTDMFFAPDVRRDPVYFSGELRQSLAFREGISALHDVVTSDLRYRAKDRSAYEEWAATQETIDWQRVAAQRRDVRDKIRSLQKELSALEEGSRKRRGPYYEALSRFRAYAWRNHLAISSILDP
ncbi:MAG TPA: SWIM zinc finger family protein, partial [Blastocatellia bacterium]|nr:SWIM zinc finger family protein [Blastocatellia bacterium]